MDKREKLINSAYYIFTKKGYNSATIEKIATHARVSKGSVYTYFKSKEAILYEVIKKISLNISERIQSVINTGNIQKDVNLIALNIHNYLMQNPAEFRLVSNKDALEKLIGGEGYVSPFVQLDMTIFNKIGNTGINLDFAKNVRAIVFDLTGDYFITKLESTELDFQSMIWNVLVGQQQTVTITKEKSVWKSFIPWLSILLGIVLCSVVVVLILNVVLFLSGRV